MNLGGQKYKLDARLKSADLRTSEHSPQAARPLPTMDAWPGALGNPLSLPGMAMILVRTAFLLVLSNLFMTFAWYAHLKKLADRPWWIAALASWGIALFEYLIQVPANRLGHQGLSIPQLKILQEAIALTVFMPFAVFYLHEPLRWNYLAAAACIFAAVVLVLRG
jgi:uncharacterized protein